ncbi:CDP-glycerol glycerophosphotransferase family protein [Streptomyces sp. NPDC039016]|uniref:CDP-glycerol glycerophosphotransferase family protein n=1 Tax=Streptomyces sp. NPDC039016 TaxID=3154330 RepID=UPI0033FCEBBD
MGEDPERWRTFPGARLVVAVARTVTSTVRVLDVLRPVLRDDPRVHLVFAFDPTSAFNDGVHALLRSVGARVLPWHQFARVSPDLIITATENADLTAAHHTCPVLVLPHGVGFHKVVPDSRSDRDRLAGVVPDALLHSGRAWLAISHPDQAAQLAAAHPATAGRTLLVGDPCHDALLDGRALRTTYRTALGIADGRRLIMLSSTWRDHSVLGRDPALPARLLAELPLDDYAVALVTHPNITSAHGSYVLRSHLDSAHDAGLLTIPPTAGWQATLLAADLLIGDHGSVTFYGAALGTPLLLGAFGDDEAVDGTPMAELGRIAPRLRPDAALRPQIERVLGLGRVPGDDTLERLRKVGESAFAAPGRALELLRTAVYDLLRLPEPADGSPPPRRAPEPPVPQDRPEPVTACYVHTSLSEDSGDSWGFGDSRDSGDSSNSGDSCGFGYSWGSGDSWNPGYSGGLGDSERPGGFGGSGDLGGSGGFGSFEEAGCPRISVERTPAAVAAFSPAPVPLTSDSSVSPVPSISPVPSTTSGSAMARGDGPDGPYRHLSCADDEGDRRWPESASVLVRRAPAGTTVAADRWIEDTLARYPGCLLAAATVTGRGCRVGLRDGRTVEVSATGPKCDATVLAAVVYACLRARRPPTGFVTLVLGDRSEDAVLRLTRRASRPRSPG